jgi:hypothetical protein
MHDGANQQSQQGYSALRLRFELVVSGIQMSRDTAMVDMIDILTYLLMEPSPS